MDLLETILRSADAERYIKNFRDYSIDSSTLKILTSEDLKILGVDDEEVEKTILKHVENLQIPSELKLIMVFDKEYIETVLDQMNSQLNRHLANLSCANLRDDLIVCDVQLTPAVKILDRSISSLEKTLESFRDEVLPTKKRKRKKTRNYLFPTILATAFAMFMCRKYILSNQ